MDFIRSFLKFWKKPHPFIFNRTSVFIPFAITFLVLVVFQPFSFKNYTSPELLFWSSLFALIPAACVLLVVKFMQWAFPKMLDEESWTFGKEALLIFSVTLVIALAVFCLFLITSSNASANHLFRLVLFRTVFISIFPILVLVLYEQYAHQKKQWKAATRINEELRRQQQELHQKNTSAVGIEKIRLMGENNKMALQLDAHQLVYIRSEGNYADVFHKEGAVLVKTLVRNSLKALETQLPQSNFFRCHRSYLISLPHIQKVDGNARNLELTMDRTSERIPVSRSKSKELLEQLEATDAWSKKGAPKLP